MSFANTIGLYKRGSAIYLRRERRTSFDKSASSRNEWEKKFVVRALSHRLRSFSTNFSYVETGYNVCNPFAL